MPAPGRSVVVVRELGLLCVGVGFLLLTMFDDTTPHTVGLGLWWCGMILLVDVLMGREGLPAQTLWGSGFGGGVYVLLYTDLPRRLSEGAGQLVVPALSLPVAVGLLLRRPR
jgi:hypothetical protein